MLNFKTLRQVKRSRQIISVLIKYGLDYFIDQAKISFWLKIKKKPERFQELTPPKRLRLALEELGPTFVKFGQILSTRPDFLPPDFIKELEKLQDKVPPFSSFQAKKIIEKELNKPLEKLFKKFETKPIAAASLSQVHKAILPNNEVIAVKVQRPGIREIIELDLKILEDLAGFLENRLYNGWVYQPKLIIRELKKAIKREIDFINEAYNFERFRINFKDIEYIKVPKIYWEMSTSKVLTMEFIKGTKIDEITQEKYKNIFDPKKVAKRGAQAILKQILEDGFFHADPHPANILVQPPATIVMLDVGMVGYLDKETIFKIAKLLQAIIDKNLEQIINCLENLGVVIKEIDGFKHEPMELLNVNVSEEFSGKVIEIVTKRKGDILNIGKVSERINLEFKIPARGLIGLSKPVLTATKGEAVISHRFKGYEPWKGDIQNKRNGALIAMETGTAVAYSIDKLQDRGKFFIEPMDKVYAGQVIGESTRLDDMVINVTKTKKLSNMRASGSDDKVAIAPAIKFSLEEAMEYVREDEFVEVTPKSIRLRKILLNELERKRKKISENK